MPCNGQPIGTWQLRIWRHSRPTIQFVLWDTDAKINGLVAADLNTPVSQVFADFEGSAAPAFPTAFLS